MSAQESLFDILFAAEPPKPVVAPQALAKPAQRHYWRCPDCLSVSVTEGPVEAVLPRDAWGRMLNCALCGVRCEYMGRVNIRTMRLEQTREVCACNEKCQSATGPNCSCICGGANHGVSMFVKVVCSTSAIPEITPIDRKAEVRRDEYRAALKAARERIAWAFAAMERKRQGAYLADQVYWPAREALAALANAKQRAQHGPRLKALAKVGVRP